MKTCVLWISTFTIVYAMQCTVYIYILSVYCWTWPYNNGMEIRVGLIIIMVNTEHILCITFYIVSFVRYEKRISFVCVIRFGNPFNIFTIFFLKRINFRKIHQTFHNVEMLFSVLICEINMLNMKEYHFNGGHVNSINAIKAIMFSMKIRSS